MNVLSYLFAAAAGAANPAQAGANAQLNKGLAAPVWTAAFVYASGLAFVLFLELLLREVWPGNRLASDGLRWWAWTGGILSIGSTMAGLTLAQKMGSGTFTGVSLTAALLSSIVLDQFGWMGFRPHPVNALRIAGAGLMISGIWMVAKS